MLCNFTVGLEVVSFLNLASELSPPPSDNSTDARNVQLMIHFDNDDPDQPTLQKVYRCIEAGLWHSGPFGTSTPGGPSESRVYLDLARLVSFYDTDLFPSLVAARWRSSAASRVGANRMGDEVSNDLTEILFHRAQRLRGLWRVERRISKADQSSLVRQLDNILRLDTFGRKHGSGVDWASLLRIIKDRYSDRLENLLHGLHGDGDSSSSPVERLRQAHQYIDGMLTPYILNGVRPQVRPTTTTSPTANHSWAVPIFRECAITHVRSMYVLMDEMIQAEVLLLEAASGVLHEICWTIVGLWAQGIEPGLDLPSSSSSRDFTASYDDYTEKITNLVVWLDWSAWFKCRNPTCAFEEMCYLPTWPFFHNLKPGLPSMPPRRNPDWGDPDDTSEWDFPRPRCYRRVAPFKLP